jgi:hypothetical protein
MPHREICFAILAHDNRAILDEQIARIRHLTPGADVVVYNGGDHLDTTGLDADVCPTSRRLTYTNLGRFHGEVMRWLATTGRTPGYLVTLDRDAELVKAELGSYLRRVMSRSAYMGVRFHKGLPGWQDIPLVRRARWKWQERWKHLLMCDEPYHSFNAVQVFGGEYVEKVAALPQLQEILDRASVSRLRGMEEIIYATLAVSLECRPVCNPSEAVIQLRWFRIQELMELLCDARIYWIHRISMSSQASDRRLINDYFAGRLRPLAEYDDRHARSDFLSRLKTHAERFCRRRGLDIYTAILPEVPRSYRKAAHLSIGARRSAS